MSDLFATKRGNRFFIPRFESYLEVPSGCAVYFHMSAHHPAYPAIIRWLLVREEGQVHIKLNGHYGGSAISYLKWYRRVASRAERAQKAYRLLISNP